MERLRKDKRFQAEALAALTERARVALPASGKIELTGVIDTAGAVARSN